MRLLMDTHAVLWFLSDAEKLSAAAFGAILEPSNEKYVSIASAWEFAVKLSIGKLKFEGGVECFLNILEDNGFGLFPIKGKHIVRLENLPFHHRDPFDRMLVATAMSEDMSIVSGDSSLSLYGVPIVW